MKSFLLPCLLFFVIAGGIGTEATCYKCEMIREENKNLPPPEYEFYDEYLESLKKKKEAIAEHVQEESE
ncbi:MAG: hypothetical protein H7A37_06400 [Chlamydiales bacterium]|nr:hypothetical protein [Chlamydiia bacterium]MCP5507912.1 hypothetical protein [Chlamydiales bacterium]